MKRRPYDPTSRHGMMRAAREQRRQRRQTDAWARSKGFADAAEADAHHVAEEARLAGELDAEAAGLGITRRQLLNSMEPERIRAVMARCHPLRSGPIIDDIEF